MKTRHVAFAVLLAFGSTAIVTLSRGQVVLPPESPVSQVADHLVVVEPSGTGTSGNSWENTIHVMPDSTTQVVIRPLRHQTWERMASVKPYAALGNVSDVGAFSVSEPVMLDDDSGFSFIVDTRSPKEVAQRLQGVSHFVSFQSEYWGERRGNPELRGAWWTYYVTTGLPLSLGTETE